MTIDTRFVMENVPSAIKIGYTFSRQKTKLPWLARSNEF